MFRHRLVKSAAISEMSLNIIDSHISIQISLYNSTDPFVSLSISLLILSKMLVESFIMLNPEDNLESSNDVMNREFLSFFGNSFVLIFVVTGESQFYCSMYWLYGWYELVFGSYPVRSSKAIHPIAQMSFFIES
jgi:hypothetical protein